MLLACLINLVRSTGTWNSLPSKLAQHWSTFRQYWNGLSNASQILRAADNRDWSSNLDSVRICSATRFRAGQVLDDAEAAPCKWSPDTGFMAAREL